MTDDAEFVEHFAVYLPADQSLTSIAAWLTTRLPNATLTADGQLAVPRRTQSPSLFRLVLRGGAPIRAELDALAQRGQTNLALRKLLAPLGQRLDLEPDDERQNIDDLMTVFAALTAMPAAVATIESDADEFIEVFVGESSEPFCVLDRDK